MKRKAPLLLAALLAPSAALAQTFIFGGYVKLDVLASKYLDGAPLPAGPLRDLQFPAQIPVGGATDIFGETSVHAKESRFHFPHRKEVESTADEGR